MVDSRKVSRRQFVTSAASVAAITLYRRSGFSPLLKSP